MSANAMPNHKELIREEWTAAAPQWQKWTHKRAIQTHEVTELMVNEARLSPGMKVLDLASGAGEPALSVAKAVSPHGCVVATDLIPGMLDFLRQNAAVAGLSNMDFRPADAESLPFDNSEFDRVTCRFGIMFFPDIQKAMTEIHRVLKPGGRLCVAVFGSLQENPIFGATFGPFQKRLNPPPPPPDAPHIFRFADEVKLSQTIRAGGFRDVNANKQRVLFSWPGPAEEYWAATREFAVPLRKMFEALPPQEAQQAGSEVIEQLRRFQSDGQVNAPATVIIGTGTA
jgi:ubiquinone/menaquinone biosynthesis C-methylase UbiE